MTATATLDADVQQTKLTAGATLGTDYRKVIVVADGSELVNGHDGLFGAMSWDIEATVRFMRQSLRTKGEDALVIGLPSGSAMNIDNTVALTLALAELAGAFVLHHKDEPPAVWPISPMLHSKIHLITGPAVLDLPSCEPDNSFMLPDYDSWRRPNFDELMTNEVLQRVIQSTGGSQPQIMQLILAHLRRTDNGVCTSLRYVPAPGQDTDKLD